jgi:hypothetical protein
VERGALLASIAHPAHRDGLLSWLRDRRRQA